MTVFVISRVKDAHEIWNARDILNARGSREWYRNLERTWIYNALAICVVWSDQ